MFCDILIFLRCFVYGAQRQHIVDDEPIGSRFTDVLLFDIVMPLDFCDEVHDIICSIRLLLFVTAVHRRAICSG